MAGTKPTKDRSAMLFIVIVLLLSLIGAGAGFAVGSILKSGLVADITIPAAESVKPGMAAETSPAAEDSHAVPAAKQDGERAHGSDRPAVAEEEVEETELIDPHSLRVVPFPPILTTLAEPKGKWIRLEGSILTTTEAEDPPEVLAERSGEQILTYLRSVRLDQIEGPTNVLGFREDLNEMLQVLSKGQVRGVLINGLVVE